MGSYAPVSTVVIPWVRTSSWVTYRFLQIVVLFLEFLQVLQILPILQFWRLRAYSIDSLLDSNDASVFLVILTVILVLYRPLLQNPSAQLPKRDGCCALQTAHPLSPHNTYLKLLKRTG